MWYRHPHLFRLSRVLWRANLPIFALLWMQDTPLWVFALVIFVELSISCDVLLTRTVTDLTSLYKFQVFFCAFFF